MRTLRRGQAERGSLQVYAAVSSPMPTWYSSRRSGSSTLHSPWSW
ncbi:MAG: hypothetical protein OER21_08760 [Gemmatimonadota bacterium]|nr:hypothetical protein [Gemmatimonadota bacterium]